MAKKADRPASLQDASAALLVEACVERVDRRVARAPIRDDEAREIEITLEHGAQGLGLLAGPFAVDAIVGAEIRAFEAYEN